MDRALASDACGPIIEVRHLVSSYEVASSIGRPKRIRAVDDVSLAVHPGETLGIVGESGSGKSTLARTIVGFKKVASGEVIFEGSDISRLSRRDWRRQRSRMQLVVQDPHGALDPRMRVGTILEEPLEIAGIATRASRRQRCFELLAQVGLPRRLIDMYPRQLSGGQCQRVGIARALAMDPRLLVCDEVVSALDVSVQAQILNLLTEIQSELKLAMIFISHDIAVTLHMSDTIGVMYSAKLVEVGSRSQFTRGPMHPYSRALTASALSERPEDAVLEGEPASPASPPLGCRFHPRCRLYRELGEPRICVEIDPPLVGENSVEGVACHFAGHPGVEDAGVAIL